MSVMETEFLSKEKPPKCCSYCDEEKSFLMVKPTVMAFNGEMTVSINCTSKPLWTCLECFSMDLDMLGHSVDIHEYDE